MKKKIVLIIVMVFFIFLSKIFFDATLFHLMVFDFQKEIQTKIEKELGVLDSTNLIKFNANESYQRIVFSAIGLANYKKAKEHLMDLNNNKSPFIMVAYSDFIHPLVLLIINNEESLFLHDHFIGELEKGLTEVYFHKGDNVIIKNSQRSADAKIAVFGEYSSWTEMGNRDMGGKVLFPFLIGNRGDYDLLFFVVFILTFSIIAALSYFKSSALLFSFVFYFEMALLISGRLMLYSPHYYWRFFIGETLIRYFPIIIIVGIFYGLYSLIKRIRRKELTFQEIVIILFFVALPFALRF